MKSIRSRIEYIQIRSQLSEMLPTKIGTPWNVPIDLPIAYCIELLIPLASFWCLWGAFGSPWGDFGIHLAPFGVHLAAFGVPLGPFGVPWAA